MHMTKSKISGLLILAAFIFSTSLLANPSGVIKELKDGNARYVKGAMSHPHQNIKRRNEIASSQHPKSIVLSCSDSRVPPELVFDQGLGDLFVVRVAGNVLDDVNLGSIEYAIEHVGVKTIVVLGHSRCGAVTAAVKGGEAHGHVKSVVDKLKSAVNEAKKNCDKCDLVETAGHANVQQIVKKLRSMYDADIVGAYYDLDSGHVEFLE